MKTVLLVDDDPMIIDLYNMKFSKRGYRVQSLTEPEKLLAYVASNPPDILLLDRRMGEIDGLELFKQLRLNGKIFPVIIMSNLDPEADELAAIKSLAPAEYVVKEKVDLNQLADKVKTFLGE